MRYFSDLAKRDPASSRALRIKQQQDDSTTKITNPLTSEQQKVIDSLEQGNSVVVDSCVGSGKTRVLHQVSNHFTNKRILYLTYNRLLKLDAQDKILNRNTTVQNYHGFVFSYLIRRGLKCTPDKQIKTFLDKCSDVPLIYDIICIDEYQDLEEDTVALLLHIHKECPNAQWVFVGDLAQKIYDKTRIDVYKNCVDKICPDYEPIQFTQCFRINQEHASYLSNIWEKPIIGTNNNCEIIYTTAFTELLNTIDSYDNKDILIIGPRYGLTPELVNILENHNPSKYNKSTVWTSIRDKEDNSRMEPDSLIVTTYDGCKGMERKLCVVIDWTDTHYSARVQKPFVDQQIITNLFCVAGSRGKEKILFYGNTLYDNEYFSKEHTALSYKQDLPSFDPDTMFDFKYQADIKDCIEHLKVTELVQHDQEVIETKTNDANIDLTPCINNYQHILFFKNYDFESKVGTFDDTAITIRIKKLIKQAGDLSPEQKALTLTALDTQLYRYVSQTSDNFIDELQSQKLYDRLKERFDPHSLRIQVKSHIVKNFTATGRVDYIDNNNIPWGLTFANSLNPTQLLRMAMYSIMRKAPKAYLWNTKLNTIHEIIVKDAQKFLDQVYKTITMGRKLRRY